MKLFARLLLVTVLAVFTAGSVAFAAGSAQMAATMIVASDEAAMDMPECDPCGASDAGEMGIACDLVCGAGGFAAVLAPQTQSIVQAPHEALWPAVAQGSYGLTGPPAKQPPRTLI